MSDGIQGWKEAGKQVAYPKIGATQADLKISDD
jgi:hypothetical protein